MTQEIEQLKLERDMARALAYELLPFLQDYVKFGVQGIGAPPDEHEADGCPDCEFYEEAVMWKSRLESGEIAQIIGRGIDLQ